MDDQKSTSAGPGQDLTGQDDGGGSGQPPVQPGAPIPAPPQPAPPKLKEQVPASADAAARPAEKVAGIDVAESDKVAKAEGDEYWENYAREIELEKEIAEMGGVEKVESGEVKVPEEIAKQMGVKPAVTAETPMATAAGFSVRGVSLGDDQVAAGLTRPTSSGLRWLIEWFIYQLKKAHVFVKKIKGKVMKQKE